MFEVITSIKVPQYKAFEGRITDEAKLDQLYRSLLRRIGNKGVELYQKHTPIGTDDKMGFYHMDRYIDKSDVNKHPGGYSIDIGIKPIEEAAALGEDPEYPRYVDEGTGIYNLKRSKGNITIRSGKNAGNFASTASARITPKTKQFMVFEWAGHSPTSRGAKPHWEDNPSTFFLKSTKGQRGQHFSDKVEKELNQYIRIQKQEFKALIGKAIKQGLI